MITTMNQQFSCEFLQHGIPDSISNGGYKDPRRWQTESFHALKDSRLRICCVPTGAGKSFLIMSLVAHDAQLVGVTPIIAVPRRDIGNGFTPDQIQVPDIGNYDFAVLDHNNLIKHAADHSKTEPVIDVIIDRLENKTNDPILITHQSLALVYQHLVAIDRLELLDSTSLIIDEAHHVKHTSQESIEEQKCRNILGNLVKDYIESNRTLTLVTATFFRGDRLNIVPGEQLDMFSQYTLAWDEYLNDLTYLKRMKFNIYTYADDLNTVMNMAFSERIGKSIVFLPHVNSSYYTDNNATKNTLVKDVFRSAADDQWCINETDKHVCHTAMRDGKKLVAIDLVDSSRKRKKSIQYIADHSRCVQNGPDVIVSLNMFKEGSDYPLADRCFIINHRGSLTDVMQMIGRTLRDVKNKEEVEINFVVRHNNTDSMRDNINSYLNAIITMMLLEEVVNAPSPLDQGNGSALHVYQLFDSPDQYSEFLSVVFDRIIAAEDNVTVGDLITEVCNLYDITDPHRVDFVKRSVITKLSKRVHRERKQKNKWENEIEINLIDDVLTVADVNIYMSKLFGQDLFDSYRTLLRTNITRSLNNLNKIIDFIESTGRLPMQHPNATTNDEIEERKLHIALHHLQVRHKEGGTYKECIDLVIQRGQPTILQKHTTVDSHMNRSAELTMFFKKHNRMPLSEASDPTERSLRSWLCGRRLAKKGKTKGRKWHQECEDYVIAQGLPIHTFDDPEDVKNLTNTIDLIEFVKANHRVPSKRADDDPRLHQIANWLTWQRKQYIDGTLTPELQKLADDQGLKYLFAPGAIFQAGFRIKECVDFINNNRRLPMQTIHCKVEKSLNMWLMRQRQLKADPASNWDPTRDDIAAELGIPLLFTIGWTVDEQ